MTVADFDNPRTSGGLVYGKEYLGSVAVGADLHAAYPTASHTLCGSRFFGRPDPRGRAPDCVECAETAAVFDRIDDSAPPTWRKR